MTTAPPAYLIAGALSKLTESLNSLEPDFDIDGPPLAGFFWELQSHVPSTALSPGVTVVALRTDEEGPDGHATIHHYAADVQLITFEFDGDYIIFNYTEGNSNVRLI